MIPLFCQSEKTPEQMVQKHKLLIEEMIHYNEPDMSFTLQKAPKSVTMLWTEEEKAARLQALFGGRTALLPDDDFYNQAASADDLEAMAKPIKKQLNLRTRKLHCRFSSSIDVPGIIDIHGSEADITISSRYIHRPYKCAALLAHALCHYSLIVSHKIYFDDPSENEKLADLASVQAGLGLILLNGLWTCGWRGALERRLNMKGDGKAGGIGYFSPKTYIEHVRSYLEAAHVPASVAADHLLPWTGQLAAHSKQALRTPLFVAAARRQHGLSVERFFMSCFIIAGFIGVGLYGASRRPAFLSDELRIQKSKVDMLESSYLGCAQRIIELEKTYGTSDPAIKRAIDARRTECKSLENRYNFEAENYNRLRTTYDKY